MTAPDRYRFEIACLFCDAAGTVKVTENDGWSFVSQPERDVEAPAGFTTLSRGLQPMRFRCNRCQVEVPHD
jgi:hypothetical protein